MTQGTSHYMPWNGLLFGSLDQVQIGDLIVLRDDTYLYLYEAISNEVISAYLVEVIDEIPEVTLITLITCTADGEKRVVVQGEFIEQILIDGTRLEEVLDIENSEITSVLEIEIAQFPLLEVVSAVIGSLVIAGLVTWLVNKKN